MGVKGLWRLLLPIGRRISIETLEGKVLAIDASIWLTQFIKAMRDPESGRVQAAAHLVGFFRRICRLLFHGIRPVFVFDGATPEIKKIETERRRRRRELVLSSLGEAAVQRMARRLLAQNLIKTHKQPKRTKSGSALSAVEGFNPGDQERTNHDETVSSDQDEEKHEVEAVDSSTFEDEDQEEVAIDDVSYRQGSDKGNEEANDWDLPLEVEDALAREEGFDGNDNGYRSDVGGYDDEDFGVDDIFSLPKEKRKQAIEDAKRQQRMKSRKEFMPAAADPLQFSQVQLTNFLRSSRLNRDIEKMATRAAQKENEGLVGEALASDRTTRVELIRENQGTDLVEKDRGNHARRLRKLGYTGRARSESSDEDWEETEDGGERGQIQKLNDRGSSNWEDGVARLEAPYHGQQRRIIYDEDTSSDDESSPDLRVCEGNPKDLSVAEDDSRNESGGFLRGLETESKRERVHVRASGATESLQVKGDSPGTLDFCSDVKLSAHSSDGNRLSKPIELPSTDSEQEVIEIGQSTHSIRLAPSSKSFLDVTILAVVPKKSSTERTSACASALPENLAQSLQDEALADALQRIEYDDSGSRTNVRYESRIRSIAGVVDISEDNDDSDDLENVEWEEGGVDGGESLQSLSVDAGEVPSVPKLTGSNHSVPHYGSSEEFTRDSFDCDQNNNANDSSSNRSVYAHDKNHAVQEAETMAALARAQETASRLADWAGRAFKRIVKEVNQANIAQGAEAVSVSFAQTNKDADHGEEFSCFDGQSPAVTSREQESSRSSALTTNRQDSTSTFDALEISSKRESMAYSMLDQDENDWKSERNRKERDLDTVTDEMRAEVVVLLQLFGIPFVEAPAEAEAQCCVLEEYGLVDGIVTEDSDVFVFGGKTVYKNIFEDKKYAEVYKSADADHEMSLARNQLVALAMLLGGDYTAGVTGVGLVNGMEILNAFDVTEDVKLGLLKFKQWLDGLASIDSSDLTAAQKEFHQKHLSARTRWIVPENFPSDRVIQAYMNPVVDKSREKFSWGKPDLAKLLIFCSRNIGWSEEETKRLLDPLLKRRGARQTRLDSFMAYEDKIKFASVRSKRLRDVLGLKKDTEVASKTQKRK